MKITLLSGATGGIGRAMLFALTKENASDEYWLIGRNSERLSALAAEVAPARVRLFPLDAVKEGALAPLALALSEAGASVNYLIAAAGVGYAGDFSALPPEAASAMLRLNAEALTALVATALPYMERGGRMLTLSSAAAFLPQPGFSVYAASKAYVLSFSRALGRELAPRGIRVTAVCPGPVSTPFLQEAARYSPYPAEKKARFALSPERVAAAALSGARRGKAVVVPGFLMKAARVAAKVLPHRLLMAFFD